MPCSPRPASARPHVLPPIPRPARLPRLTVPVQSAYGTASRC